MTTEAPSPTLALGSRFEGLVRGLSSEGLGVVEGPDGRVFFVEGAWPGDKAEFEITSLKGRYGYASLSTLIEPSPDRREPPCPHQGIVEGKCGGCPWMIGTYESQLRAKEHRLEHALSRAGILKPGSLQRIWGSPSEFGYRNRAQFKTNGVELGFVSRGSHSIAAIQDCIVLSESTRAELARMVGSLPREDWKPGPKHDWNFIDLDEELARERAALRESGSEEAAFVLNRRRPFQQGNSAQNVRMQKWIAERMAKIGSSAPVLELFCGSGNFTQIISALGFRDIVAVEVASDALKQLEARDLAGVKVRGLDLSKRSSFQRLAREFPGTRVLVLDPPREGSKGVDILTRSYRELQDLLYVSCDIATFVRDASDIAKSGFELIEVQPLDLFPQTSHVEVLAHFRRV